MCPAGARFCPTGNICVSFSQYTFGNTSAISFLLFYFFEKFFFFRTKKRRSSHWYDAFSMFVLLVCLIHQKNCLDHDGTFETFFLQFATDLVRFVDVAVELVGVGMATAATIEACPAVGTFRFVEDVRVTKRLYEVLSYDTFIETADAVLFAADELVTRIEVTVGCDGEVFVSCATAHEAFGNARAVVEVEVEVEEGESFACELFVEVDFGEFFVFFEQFRQVFFFELVRCVFGYDGFYGELVEAFIEHGEYVFREVEVVACERSAQVVVVEAPRCDGAFHVAYDGVVTSFAAYHRAHIVMDFFSSVEAQDKADVLVVEELFDLFGETETVRREREFENFARFGLSLVNVFGDGAYRFHVHERFAAEEVEFAVFAMAAVLYDEVDCLFTDFDRHETAVVTEIARSRKTVLTTEVAVMRDVETERFDERFVFERERYVEVGREELLSVHQFVEVVEAVLKVSFIILARECLNRFFVVVACKYVQEVVDELIRYVDGTAVDVEDDVVTVLLKFMYFQGVFLHFLSHAQIKTKAPA